jgi:hypothetical protein
MFVIFAVVVVAEVLALRRHEQKPAVVFGKNGGVFVQNIPSIVFKICPFRWGVNSQSKVSAAFTVAVIAQIGSFRQSVPIWLGLRNFRRSINLSHKIILYFNPEEGIDYLSR